MKYLNDYNENTFIMEKIIKMYFLLFFTFTVLFTNLNSSKILILSDQPNRITKNYLQDLPSYVLNSEIFSNQLDNEICAIISTQNISAIIDLSMQRYASLYLNSLSSNLNLPIISFAHEAFRETTTINYNGGGNFIMNFERVDYSLVTGIREILDVENVTNAAILFDRNTYNFELTPKYLLKDLVCSHVYYEFDVKDSNKSLGDIKFLGFQNIFVIINPENLDYLHKQIQINGMFSEKFRWYFISFSTDLCPMCSNKNKNFVSLTPFFHPNKNMVAAPGGDVYDIFLKDILQASKFALNTAIFTRQYPNCEGNKMTMMMTESNDNNFLTQFESYLSNNGTLKLRKNTITNTYQFDVNFNITSQNKTIALWNSVDGFVTKESLISNSPKNIYRVVTVVNEPFVFKSKTLPETVKLYYFNETTGYYFYGYCIDLIEHIRKNLNFEYVLLEPADNLHGRLQPNGSWNGMVLEVLEDRADIILGAFSMMSERENAIDYTKAFYEPVGLSVMIKNPSSEYSLTKFLEVLEGPVWACIITAVLIVSVLFTVFDKYSPYSYQNNKEKLKDCKETRIFNLMESVWFTCMALTPQGGGETPRQLSGRIMASMWYIFAFLVVSTYTANLAAFLTVSRLNEPVNSVDDLAGQFKVKYATMESSAGHVYFKRMKDIESKFYNLWKNMSLNLNLSDFERAQLAVWDYPLSDKYSNIWYAMEKSTYPRSLDEAIDRIKNRPNDEDFAFIGDSTAISYATLTDCDLWKVGKEFSKKPYAIGVYKSSRLKHTLSQAILHLLQLRILEDMKLFWWQFSDNSCNKIVDESHGISIRNIGGVFFIALFGYVSGFFMCLFEYYQYKYLPEKKIRMEAKLDEKKRRGLTYS